MTRIQTRSQFWGSVALVSTLFLTFFLIMVGATAGRSPIQAAGIAALTSLTLEYGRRQKLAGLRSQLARSERSTLCVVRINGIVAGSVPEPDYIKLRIGAMLSARNYIGQFIEILRFVLTSAAAALVAGPLLIFWIFIIAAAVTPESVRHDLMAAYITLSSAPTIASTASMVHQLAMTVITMTATLGILACGAAMFFTSRFPIASVFERDVDEKLRRLTGSLVRGDVYVSRTVATAHGADSGAAVTS